MRLRARRASQRWISNKHIPAATHATTTVAAKYSGAIGLDGGGQKSTASGVPVSTVDVKIVVVVVVVREPAVKESVSTPVLSPGLAVLLCVTTEFDVVVVFVWLFVWLNVVIVTLVVIVDLMIEAFRV